MKFPSLDHIYQKATTTLRRFPFTLASSAIVTAIIIYLTQASQSSDTIEQMLGKITMCGFLGVPLFTVITLFAEKKEWRGAYWWISHAAGLALLIAYYFTLPADLNGHHYVGLYRYGLFILGTHLLVAIGPYWGQSGQMPFWQYNKLLFLRFLTALLFSAVFYIGLAVALLSIQVLLGVDIKYEIYVQLYTFIGVMFNTWFFLAGIPTSLQVFKKHISYPKGLKIFAQNVLLPLVVVYVAILYLYMFKMIGQWTWPEGWVAILVLSFSIVGILAILLLYPVRHKAENKWINRFYTGYFAALVPLVILLLLAIYRRVADYGVTINRYFVIILALWLAGMVIYFLVSKAQNIKVIPGSLCVLAFLTSFGPWGVFSVSRRSQVQRLEGLLKQNDILKGGEIHKSSSEVPGKDRDDVVSIIRYLNNTDDLNAIQPWFDQSLTKETVTIDGKDSVKTISHYARRSRAIKLMGIESYSSYPNSKIAAGGTSDKSTIRNYAIAQQKNFFPVRDFDWFIQSVRLPNRGELRETYSINDREVMVESSEHNAKLFVYNKDAKENGLTVDMNDIVQKLQGRVSDDQHQLPVRDLTFPVSNDHLQINLYMMHLNWYIEGDSMKQIYGNFSIALNLK